MQRTFLTLTVFLICLSVHAAQDTLILRSTDGEPGPIPLSLQKEAAAAIDRALDWLLAQQTDEGHWSSSDFPALTALPVWALANADRADNNEVEKAVKYILRNVHENGSIYHKPEEQRKGGGLSTYNTALCMVALHALNDPALRSIILKAREFVTKSQHLGGDEYRGGMGYDPSTGRAYADLSNSYVAYEAMRLTEDAEDHRKQGEKKADLEWDAAVEFLEKTQNLPGNTGDPDQKGGFIYKPGESKAGTYTDAEGVIRFRSYGSMTYAGLLSLIYANVSRDDPRVRSAHDWAAKHWTLDENPGMGASGLYYFYNVLAKAMTAYGRDQVHIDGGRKINWRAELIRKLLELQKIDPKTGGGYWINEKGRWWEADPVLVTSYSILALQAAMAK